MEHPFPEFFDAPISNVAGAADFSRKRSGPRVREKIHSAYQYVNISENEYDGSVVKSAHRVLQVFEFFAECGRPAGATEIAANLDFPQSSTSMLLRSLVSLGYLRFIASSREFAPTIRLSLLGAWDQEQTKRVEAIVEGMRELNAQFGECFVLADKYRHFARYIHVVQSTDPDKVLYVPHGTLRPICSTACGQVLLAGRDDRDMRSTIHAARSDEGSVDYGVRLDAVAEAAQRCRENGYAFTSRVVNGARSYQLAVAVGGAESADLAVGVTWYNEGWREIMPRVLAEMLALSQRFAIPRSHP